MSDNTDKNQSLSEATQNAGEYTTKLIMAGKTMAARNGGKDAFTENYEGPMNKIVRAAYGQVPVATSEVQAAQLRTVSASPSQVKETIFSNRNGTGSTAGTENVEPNKERRLGPGAGN